MSPTRFAHRARGILTTITAVVAATLLLFVVSGAEAHAAGRSERALTGMPTLARGAGYADVAGSPQVRRLQRWLRRVGVRPGPIDGLFGPLTEGAVFRFQRARGLRQDGIAGPVTLRHLRPRSGSRAQARRVARRAAPSTPSTAARPAVTPDTRSAPAAPARTARPGSDDAPIALIAAVAIVLVDLALLLRIAVLRRRDARRRRPTASPADAAHGVALPSADHGAPSTNGLPLPVAEEPGEAIEGVAPSTSNQDGLSTNTLPLPLAEESGEGIEGVALSTSNQDGPSTNGLPRPAADEPVRAVEARAVPAGAASSPGIEELAFPTGDEPGPEADGFPTMLDHPDASEAEIVHDNGAAAVHAPSADAPPEPSAHERVAVLVIDARSLSGPDEPEEGSDRPPGPDTARDGAPPPSRHRMPGGLRVAGRKSRRSEAERVRSHVRHD